jgi:hypothetical protein
VTKHVLEGVLREDDQVIGSCPIGLALDQPSEGSDLGVSEP